MKRVALGVVVLLVGAAGVWYATRSPDPAPVGRMDASAQRELAQEIGYLK